MHATPVQAHPCSRLLRPLLTVLLAAPLLGATLVGTAASAQAAGPLTDVRINEVESNGGAPGDWVELVNVGAETVDVSGLRVKDNDDTRTFAIPAGSTIPAGGFLAVDVDVTGGFGLGANDAARLYTSDGATLIDSYTWASHAATTYGRCPDGSGSFRTTSSSTRGAANDCSSPVRLNEVESSGGSPGDWVELVNPSASPADVSGFVVKDDDDTHAVTIPAATTIPAGGLLVVDTEPTFGLGSADSARLFGADGTTLVDSYTWAAHATTTYGRCPSGTGAFATTTTSTRGTANDCGAVVPPGLTFNEVESNGDLVGDWAELVNTGVSAIDLGGLKFKDGDDTHAFYEIPAATSIPAGGYYVLNEAQFGFGLGAADSVRLFLADGVTSVATYAWASHAATTYGRCPDGTGSFTTTTSPTKGAANDCSSPVRINEVESSGGTPGDWVELVNNGSASVDVSGFVLRDSADGAGYTVPAATSIAAGGYLVLDEAQFGFGLGGADSARLFEVDGTTLVDTYTWAAHAATTYGRCPNGTGAFTTTQVSSKGAANVCVGDIVAGPWPGGTSITTADTADALGGDISGLAYEGSGSSTPGVLWAVDNGGGILHRLVRSGAEWVDDAGEWSAGKTLRYADGTGTPDSEGVTLTGAGAAGGVYTATERNNAANTVSRPTILRYDATAGGSTLTATDEWNLTADLPPVAANAGLEGITWVPDSYLTAHGFLDEKTGQPYSPATYADHGTGLFLVGLEGNGRVYAYALDHVSGAFTRVASFASGFSSVMDLQFEFETDRLWVVCDDTCAGRTGAFEVETAAGATQGTFVSRAYYERPTGMPNLNNEGFAITPRSECVGDSKPVYWSDDSNTGAHALRAGTISCTPRVTQTVAFTSALPTPVVGQAHVVAATGGPSGNDVTLSIAEASASVCSLAGTTVTFAHAGTCTVRADQAGDEDHAPGSATQAVTVAKAATSISPTVTPVALTATVAPVAPGAGQPTGTVLFRVDGEEVGTAPLVDGVATLAEVVDPALAEATVVVGYVGDADFTPSSASTTRTAPTLSVEQSSPLPATAAGWHRSPVTLTYACTEGSAALVAPCPAPVVLAEDGVTPLVTRSIQAEDGGAATVGTGPIRVDRTTPTVRLLGARDGATYAEGEPTLRCSASDATSGIASCVVTKRQTGLRVVATATATDRAGIVARDTVDFRLPRVVVEDADLRGGTFLVQAGAPYRVRVLADDRPRLVGPVAADETFRGGGRAMTRDGQAVGLTSYVSTVRVPRQAAPGSAWKVRVVVDGVAEVVRLRVR